MTKRAPCLNTKIRLVAPNLLFVLWLLHFGAVVADTVALERQTPNEWQGRWVQGALLVGVAPEGHKVSYRGTALPLTSAGQFLVGLSRDAAQTAEIVYIKPDNTRYSQSFHVDRRKYETQIINDVPQDKVMPPQSALERIVSDSNAVKEAREKITEHEWFVDGFIRPLNGPITGVYGSQRIYNGIPKQPHYGVDYAAPKGTRVRAPAGGIVTLADQDMYFSGGTIIVDHGHGLSSTFLHLSKILVKPGIYINRGMEIAEVGATGRATGPHLDWRMNWRDVRIDPLLVLEALPFTKE
jgi:murein DD-endopeptidase MepM/ murein hydrolase activator NlpD